MLARYRYATKGFCRRELAEMEMKRRSRQHTVDTLGWWDLRAVFIQRLARYTTIVQCHLARRWILIRQSVLDPVLIISLWEIFASVCASGLLSGSSRVHCLARVGEKVSHCVLESAWFSHRQRGSERKSYTQEFPSNQCSKSSTGL